MLFETKMHPDDHPDTVKSGKVKPARMKKDSYHTCSRGDL